uniref:Uncharacterized protein n=1 Tax=Acanthochromis polyacanthus TaxID=80966 RepID=A0A3Q1GQ32_9TELE
MLSKNLPAAAEGFCTIGFSRRLNSTSLVTAAFACHFIFLTEREYINIKKEKLPLTPVLCHTPSEGKVFFSSRFLSQDPVSVFFFPMNLQVVLKDDREIIIQNTKNLCKPS